jgi:tripartite-type tricarboxylate transporter receptor subunit TctC
MLAAAALGALASASHAQWPTEQAIRIIVPNPPGGTNDIVARLVGEELAKRLGQTVLVENKPGASGAIGIKMASEAKPDGYTLALVSDSATLLDVLRPNPQWKFKQAVAGVAMIGDQPVSLAVPGASPFKRLSDLVDAARAKPGELGFGSSGVGSGQHVIGTWWAKLAGVDITHIPYKGGGQAAVDLSGNQVPVAVLGLAPMLTLHRNGKVRILAVTSAERHPAIPDVPTFTESGFAPISLTQWAGLVAPSATPKAIRDRLSSEVLGIVARPDIQAKLADRGMSPRPMDAETFDRHIKGEVERWDRLVPTLKLGLKP